MGRQSISLTEPNDEWLKSQVQNNEYASKSELVNDLIRQARGQQRKVDWIAAKLEHAEKSGFTSLSKESILAKFKDEMNAEL
jgi:antitoxin ParD1/3/4